MPGSSTTPGRRGARAGAPLRVAFRLPNGVGTRGFKSIAARWLAYPLPYRRFADTLTGACARLGADVGRYSFIVADSHHLLLAGLPAHSEIFTGPGAVSGPPRCQGKIPTHSGRRQPCPELSLRID